MTDQADHHECSIAKATNVRRLVVVGAGGMGRELWSMVQQLNRSLDQPAWQLVGFLATTPPGGRLLERLGAPYLGNSEDCSVLDGLRGDYFIAAIGDGRARRGVQLELRAGGLRPAVLVAHSADIGQDVHLGRGTIVCNRSVVTTNVWIGEGVQVNVNCSVSHDSRLEDFVTLAPGVAVDGSVTVQAGAFLATGASVLPGRTIGAGAIVGAGAVVTKDVPSGCTVVGVPARVIKHDARPSGA